MRDDEYGLSGADVTELRILDNERERRAADTRKPSGAYSGRDNASVALGCAVLVLVLLALAFALSRGLDGEYDPVASPVLPAEHLAVQERRLEALATRVTELELRQQRTADAAAGFEPVGPAVTSTPTWAYQGPLGQAVTPPDGIPTLDRSDGEVGTKGKR